MNSKSEYCLLLTACLLIYTTLVHGQDPILKTLSVNELFSLVIENNPSLSVSKANINIAKQQVVVAKNDRLPDFNISVNAMYIGDVTLLDPDFSNSTNVDMPHFGNIFSVEASQLIWKGSIVNNSIQAKSLQKEIAELNYLSNEQNIKLLALGYYLDLYKLQNQADVYRLNIELAEQRLKNSNRFYKEGMVTRNNVIRSELQISNLTLTLQVVTNNIQILNKQLIVSLGLPETTQIIAYETMLNENLKISILEDYQNNITNHPTVVSTKKAVELYGISQKITKAEQMPALVAFAGNTMQRPIITTTPAIDLYSNSWNVGLSLNFDIGSLYKTHKKIRLNNYEIEKAKAQANEVKQMIGVAVNAAYIKYNEAVSQNITLKKNKDLATENYRITESKYNNQLAILLDMIDASNTKLSTELQYTNSNINIIFAYYKLLKESGNL
ncbi:TolC family protein [Flavicella sp.]|uniref:TolC family protein n=1 Tax=Flavicella sp. TaxID=2957742 RepID=UPI00301A9DF9